MKTTANLMLVGAMLALSSCDLFVPPKVACDNIVLSAALSDQSTRKGNPCAFGPLGWQVAHAPKVDEKWAAENGGGSNTNLAGMPVRITGVAAALCEGVACLPTEPELNTHVDEMGRLTYGVSYGEFLVGEGKEVNKTGIVVSEIYGPGNECHIQLSVTASCAEAPETENQ